MVTTKMQAQTNVVPDDIELAVLKNIYDSLGGSTWTSSTNWPTTGNWPATATSSQFSTWKGITVSYGDISSISLTNNNLTGVIPKSIARLARLKTLYLQKNSIGGSIPVALGKITTLTNLLLDHNALTGTIPTELGNLTSLLQLTLHNNTLTGAIPSSLGNLTSLDMLNVSYNQLSGSVPSSLSQLNIATYIYLSHNQLTGTLPSFGGLANLKYFSVEYNQLTGALPSFAAQKEMLTFYIDNNQFTGSFPDVTLWTKVTDINVGNNLLTGAISTGISNCVALTSLYADNNTFTSLPTGILSLPALAIVDVNSNAITSIPDFSTQVNKANLTLKVYKNKLDFGQLEMIYNKGIKTLTYSPMSNLDDVLFAKSVPSGSVSIAARSGGANTIVNWERKVDGSSTWVNVNSLNTDATQKTYQHANNQYADAGEYRYKLTNSVITGLTIQSASTDVRVGYDQTWSNLTNVQNTSGVLSKSTANGWNGEGARARNTLMANVDGWFEFVIDQNAATANYIIGFSAINNVYTQTAIDFGVEVNSQSGLKLLAHEGSATGTDLGTVALGDVIRVGRVGSLIKYYKNGTEIRSVTGDATKYYITKVLIGAGKTAPLVTSYDVLNETGEIPNALEQAALKDMYDSLGGSAWTNSPYWPMTGTMPSSKNSSYGVWISNGDISVIFLAPSNLVGKIPASIGNLSKVTQLNLTGNKITGSIPSTIGNMTSLQYVYLGNNQITGSIPSSLQNLKSLLVLNLGYNQLSGTIPSQLNYLTNLTYLGLGVNKLTGDIPDLSGLTNLNSLGLSYLPTLNAGVIPTWIKNLHALTGLYMINTNRTGAIPDEIGTITSLTVIDLSSNQLSGSLPSSMGNLVNLNTLNLTSNQISGSIPDSFGNMVSLQYLNLNLNKLTGSIPSTFSNLTKISTLNLYSNQLSGTLPSFIGNYPNLLNLYLYNNQFTGEIPSSFGNLTKISNFQLQGNQLTGSIPSSLGNLVNVQYFYLHGNKLTGTIPSELGNLTKVLQFYISGNQLTGSIPSSLGNLSLAQQFCLNDNKLTGAVPSSLSGLSSVWLFYLQNNQLSGDFPDIFSGLSKVVTLNLYNNQFTGALPSSIGNCSAITALDFHTNRFTSVPSSMLSLPVLNAFLMQDNELKNIPDFSAQVNKANLTLNISNNRLDYSQLELTQGKGIKTIINYPQKDIIDTDFVSLITGSALTISARNPGQYSTIYWEKLSGTTWNIVNSLDTDATLKTYNRTTAALTDVGTYRWRMTNTLVGGTIKSGNIAIETGSVADAIEFAALKDLYDSLGGASWTNKTNWPTNWATVATAAQMDTWNGIDIANGDISALNLLQNNLTGKIPASISKLKGVKIIDFRINVISGTIPASMMTMTGLTNLRLYSNQLSGVIPDNIGNLTNLTELVLAKNKFVSQVPASIGNLTKLTWLSLYLNADLSGPLPSSFYNLVNLTDLYIYDTKINGSLSENIGNLTKLKTFWGYRNKWSGTLPASLGNILTLENLYLYSNNFSGTIPDNYSHLTNLKNFYVHYNPDLGGTIPTWLGGLSNMEILSLGGGGKFTGELPASIGNLSKLTQLYIWNENITGSIPNEWAALSKLTYISLNNTKLSGTIPSGLINQPALKQMYFNNSQLTGFPDISARTDKASLIINIQNNQIPITDIERYFTAANTTPFNTFIYSPQTLAAAPSSAISVTLQEQLNIQSPSGGVHGIYVYEKLVKGTWTNVTSQNQSSDPAVFTIQHATDAAEGTYRYTVTNAWVAGITYQGTLDVSVTDPINTDPVKPLFNGLISAARWHTEKAYEVTGTDFSGMYVYSYDEKYQIAEARWADANNVLNTFSFAHNKYRLTGMSYDPNGNILTLKRYNDAGVRTNNFTYHYGYQEEKPTYDNKLKSVDGYASFTYNAIGQMESEDMTDANAGDQFVEYDVTGKVTVVYTDAAHTRRKMANLYDDRGFRLAKIVYQKDAATSVPERTTWYMRDTNGNVLSIFEEDNLEEAKTGHEVITQTEVPVYGAGKLGTYYPQQDGSLNYEITDHLGNVRALLRDNSNIYVATLEDNGSEDIANPRVQELAFFNNLTTAVEDVHANQTSATQEEPNPRRAAYLNWISGMSGSDASDKSVGPAMMLKVNAGDQVKIETWAKYEIKETYTRDVTMLLLSQYLGSTFGLKGGFDGLTTSQTNSILNNALGLGNFVSDNGDQSTPFAYVNYILFDRNMNYVTSDYKRVSSEAGYHTEEINLNTSQPELISIPDPVTINGDGYIYVWVSNESENTKVWFDDLKISHTGSLVAQATDYGVWGDVLREQKVDESIYRFGYQGKFSEKDLETGWNHFEARELETMIARWTTVDNARQFYSPYISMGNNPVSFLDSDGREIIIGNHTYVPGQEYTGKNKFIRQTVESLNILYKAEQKSGLNVVTKLAADKSFILRIAKRTSLKKGMEYVNTEEIVYYIANSGLKVLDENRQVVGVQAPIVGLIHELVHAYDDLIDGMLGAYYSLKNPTYNNFAEENAVNFENIYVEQMNSQNLLFNNSLRFNHNGIPYKTKGINSTEEQGAPSGGGDPRRPPKD